MLCRNVVAVQWERFCMYKLHSVHPLKLPTAFCLFKIQQIMLTRSPPEHALGSFILKADVRVVSHPLNLTFDTHDIFVTWQLLVIACRRKCFLSGHGWSTELCPIPLCDGPADEYFSLNLGILPSKMLTLRLQCSLLGGQLKQRHNEPSLCFLSDLHCCLGWSLLCSPLLRQFR